MVRPMILGIHLDSGYGAQPGAWSVPGTDLTSYTSFVTKVKAAQAANQHRSLGWGPSSTSDSP